MKIPMSSRVEWEISAMISACVAEGRQHDLIKLFPDAEKNPPPERIGEWGLILVSGYHHKTRVPELQLIAVARSNKAQRIVKRGNIKRLVSLGFTEEDAQAYNHCAKGVSNAWVEQVILLVKHMLDIRVGLDTVNAILSSKNPRRVAIQADVYQNAFEFTVKRFDAAMSVMKNIHEHRARREAEKAERELLAVH